MHQQAADFVADAVRRFGPFQRVVEIGAYDVNGSVRPLFGDAAYTGVDMRPGPGVDVVADGARYQPDQAPDCVVCCEVLEHAPNAAAIVKNMAAMLAPGGLLIVTAATEPRVPHGVNGGGVGNEFYLNVEPGRLGGWLHKAGLTEVEVASHPWGDVYATARAPHPGAVW